MPTYERSTWVDAPLDDVWSFHSRVDGLRALTPDWMHLRVERIDYPADADPDTEELVAGTDLTLSVRPFGAGPRQRVVSHIAARDRREGEAHFVDTMREGPFAEWEHVHQFFGEGGRTLVRDRVHYELPVPVSLPAPVSNAVFDPFFRYRHRRTREILSGDEV